MFYRVGGGKRRSDCHVEFPEVSGIIALTVRNVSVVGIVQRGRILRKGIMGECEMYKKFKIDKITLFKYPSLRLRAFLRGNSVELVKELWNVDLERWDHISTTFLEIKNIRKLSKWLKELGVL